VLLGSPRVRVHGRAVPLRLRKGLALLAFCACAKGPVSRDALAELLWPESAAGQGRTRLRRTLHRLGQALGSNPLAGDNDYICVNDDVELVTDALVFETQAEEALACAADAACTAALRAAVEAYTGDFMQGFVLPDCDDFTDWQAERGRVLRQLHVELLERLVAACRRDRDTQAALAYMRRLLAIEPAEELFHRLMIELLIESGRHGAALGQYEVCKRMLRQELDVEPTEQTCALVQGLNIATETAAAVALPRTHYTASGNAHIAYQVLGEGPPDIVLIPGFVSHLEQCWMEPLLAEFLERLGSMARLILLDRRGIGLSDRTAGPPNAESTMIDIEAVMDAVGTGRAILFGVSEGGAMALKFAHAVPERVRALVLFGTMARGMKGPDYPWALDRAGFDAWLDRMVATWGGPSGIRMFAPGMADDPALRDWWARTLRLGSSPGAMRAVLEALRDLDVRDLLPEIDVPALVMHREDDRAIRVEAGRQIAEALPDSVWVRLPGDDHWPWIGETEPVLGAIEPFVSALD